MCCFSRPVRHVSKTHIFARPQDGNRQALIYSMNVTLDEDLAMILPLPVPPGGPDDAVSFVDLSASPRFFQDLAELFPAVYLAQPKSRGIVSRGAPERPKLEVHAVGAFEASYVPSPGDFDRLDPRFRLPPDTIAQLPRYADYGFAVFKLRPRRGLARWFGGSPQTIHPMAFTFPRRDPSALFFPTVHVHDGAVHAVAEFDHALYCQPGDAAATARLAYGDAFARDRWDRSSGPLGDAVPAAGALVDLAAHGYRRVLHGRLPNEDTLVIT